MKKFRLDLSEWKVTVTVPDKSKEGQHQMKQVEQVYPFKDNLSGWLRSAGVFKTGEKIAEAVLLAKTLRECKDDSLMLDEHEASILKEALNRHIEATANGLSNIPLGGEIHEEAICRVFSMVEEK